MRVRAVCERDGRAGSGGPGAENDTDTDTEIRWGKKERGGYLRETETHREN